MQREREGGGGGRERREGEEGGREGGREGEREGGRGLIFFLFGAMRATLPICRQYDAGPARDGVCARGRVYSSGPCRLSGRPSIPRFPIP